jgi:mannosyltransferase OCH1-like enzyme
MNHFSESTFFAICKDQIPIHKATPLIPKIIFQTSPQECDEHAFSFLKPFILKDWTYLHFTDEQCLKFFDENPLQGYEKIKEKFLSFNKGAHKADLFRYYFLYLNGGVFIDTDLMLCESLEYISKGFNFFSVQSSVHPKTIFQGLLGATPRHKVIGSVLDAAYNVNQELLDKNYHLMCSDMYKAIQIILPENIKLYYEAYKDAGTYLVIDESGLVLAQHFWRDKKFPRVTPKIL